MKNITEWIDEWRKRREQTRQKALKTEAEELFQIAEHDHSLWFTYAGELIAPCKLLGCNTSEDKVVLVETIRTLYIERNS